jgi:hypothetical protein
MMHSAVGDPHRASALVKMMLAPGSLVGRAFEGGAVGIAGGALFNGAIYAYAWIALERSWKRDWGKVWVVIGAIVFWWLVSLVGWVGGGEM